MAKNKEIQWLKKPEDQDYPAATCYLSLLYDEIRVESIVSELRKAPMTSFKAKDIFRASLLSLLGISNSHVRKNLKKLEAGKPLSPLLLVRSDDGGKLVIADGYHRMCSVYVLNEDADIPCKIVGASPERQSSKKTKPTRKE
jgi:hypothetical protein